MAKSILSSDSTPHRQRYRPLIENPAWSRLIISQHNPRLRFWETLTVGCPAERKTSRFKMDLARKSAQIEGHGVGH